MSITLSAPVGEKKRITQPDPKKPNYKFLPVANKKADVELVQLMLIANGYSGEVTGKVSPQMIQAIRSFQKAKCGYKKPDGIVDPGLATWLAGMPKLVTKMAADNAIIASRVKVKQKGKEVWLAKTEYERQLAETVKAATKKADSIIAQTEAMTAFMLDAEAIAQGADTFLNSMAELCVRWAADNDSAEPPYDAVLAATSAAKALRTCVTASTVDWDKVLKQDKATVKAFNKAVKAFRKYIDARVATAGSIVGKLEFASEMAFTAVEIYMTAQFIAKGNSPTHAHMLAAAATTSVKSSAGQLGEYLAGNEVEWTSAAAKVMLDTYFAAIGGAVGGKLGSAFEGKVQVALAKKLAGKFASPAMKKAIDTLVGKMLSKEFIQEIITSTAKELVAQFRTAIDKGRPPKTSEIEEAAIKIMLAGFLKTKYLKALMSLDKKAAGKAVDYIKSDMAPGMIQSLSKSWEKKYGKAFVEALPKIEPKLLAKMDEGLKGKAAEVFTLGMVKKVSTGSEEAALEKAGKNAMKNDGALKKQIMEMLEAQAKLEAKKMEMAG